MSTRLLRPTIPLPLSRPPLTTRPFLTSLLPQTTPPLQTLSATRTLPYPLAPIYSIIADVPSYSQFLPYCTRSTITHWSAPDPVTGRRWPSRGVLTTGFAGVEESFASNVYCVPGRVVESVGGGAETALSRESVGHHFEGGAGAGAGAGVESEGEGEGLLRHLRSTWTVEPVGERRTRVEVRLEFQFRNPVYAALSQGVLPRVAETMVAAFEERVESVLRDEPEMADARLQDMEGSRLRR